MSGAGATSSNEATRSCHWSFSAPSVRAGRRENADKSTSARPPRAPAARRRGTAAPAQRGRGHVAVDLVVVVDQRGRRVAERLQHDRERERERGASEAASHAPSAGDARTPAVAQ